MQLPGNRRKLEYDHTKLEGEITDADDASDLLCNSGCQTEVTLQEMTQMDIKFNAKHCTASCRTDLDMETICQLESDLKSRNAELHNLREKILKASLQKIHSEMMMRRSFLHWTAKFFSYDHAF